MMLTKIGCWVGLFCLAFLQTHAQEETQTAVLSQDFPKEISFSENNHEYHLSLTGVSLRKKLIVKVYYVASYLQSDAPQGGDILNEIMQDGLAKQLTLKWVHDVDKNRVVNGYRESFENALSETEKNQLQSELNQYLSFFQNDVKKGDVHVLRWLPGGFVEVIINDQKVGSVTNVNFAKGLWSIWFGPKSVVNRDQLISR